MTEVYRLTENVYRIKHWKNAPERESLLSKYRIIDLRPDGAAPELVSRSEEPTASVGREGLYRLTFSLDAGERGGFEIRLPLDPAERLYGLGDESRTCIEKHGHLARMWLENASSYGPVPYLMSSRGWAVLLNCTYAHVFDVAASEADLLRIRSDKGALDLIVFCGTDLHDALYLAGKVTGRPVMLPKAAYGLTFIHNERATDRSVLDDALRFQDRSIPCDFFGLEPTWMEKFYDFSTEKKWNRERFELPYWLPENYYEDNSWIWTLNSMGYALSLWLCCDYDLFWKEEQQTYRDEEHTSDALAFKDAHLSDTIRMDGITKPDEPWFEHLKKFVDNGAEAFKLDGAYQVNPHPDRIWAGKYLDDEIHNLYPVVYAKQMKEGYAEYTGRRAMINTCGVYPGTQKYAATWAGDTGCSVGVMISLMNYAMCGHSNTSFDMSSSKASLHFGAFSPWMQHNAWSNWRYPWFGGKAVEASYRTYAQLRSKLFPYLYSYAHAAAETSLPVLRPLSLTYLDTGKYDGVFTMYMLGDALLVNAMQYDVVLPDEDEWFDFFTGKKHTGPRTYSYTPEGVYGGAAFVRAGSIVVLQDWADSLRDYRPDALYVHVYPGKDASFTLYEDDGKTYGYEKGEFAETRMTLADNVLRIFPREGGYPGMPRAVDFHVVWHHDDGSEKTVFVPAADYADTPAVVEAL